MLSINAERLEQVAQAAFDAAQSAGTKDSPRWTRAIAKALRQLQENPYIHRDGDRLLILSDSGGIYEAGRDCQCPAYQQRGKYPCWHRAAARLIARMEQDEQERKTRERQRVNGQMFEYFSS